jgi:hypothetical protein
MASDSSQGAQARQGVQPVLKAIDRLYAELESYPKGSPKFEAERKRLEKVLEQVRQTLVAECASRDKSMTFLVWLMEGVG